MAKSAQRTREFNRELATRLADAATEAHRQARIDASSVEQRATAAQMAAEEAQSLPIHEPRPASPLRLRPRDATLVVSVLLPATALAAVLVPS